jgi:hypothetical protein
LNADRAPQLKASVGPHVNNERTSEMSLWVHWKERKGGRSLYLLDVPWELVFLLIGILMVLFILLLRRLGLVS